MTSEKDKIDFISKKLSEAAKDKLFQDVILVGPDGSSIGTKAKYYPDSNIVFASKKQKVTEAGILWTPIKIDNSVIFAIGIKNNKEVAKEKINLIKGYMDELLYDKYLEEELIDTIDSKSKFIFQLLNGSEIKTLDDAIDRGDIIGINLRFPQAVMVIEIKDLFKKLHKKYKNLKSDERILKIKEECIKITNEMKKMFDDYEQNIFACIGEDTFVCLKWGKGKITALNSVNFFKKSAQYLRNELEKKTQTQVTIGVGQYYPGLAGLRKSFSDAKAALNIGLKIWGRGNAYHILDIGMLVSISEEVPFERKCELAMQILGPVLSDEALFKTVNTFLESDMNLSLASKKLHLHRNTLIYRLDKIKTTVGLDSRIFSDAVQIKLGILLYGPSIRCH